MAERKNQTIMEVVKAMIHDQDLPMCRTDVPKSSEGHDVYVQNRCPHRVLGNKTRE
jgi:hypothetical protein